MRIRLRLIVPVLALMTAFLGRDAYSQDLSETVAEVGEEYARGYLAPLMDAVGANFNASLIPAARLGTASGDVNLYVGVKAFGAMVTEDQKTFNATFSSSIPFTAHVGSESVQLDIPAEITIQDAPTFFGESDPGHMMVHARQDTSIMYLGMSLPISIDTSYTVEGIGGLADIDIAPFLVPEAVVGTFLGTDVMLRWLPRITIEDAESIGVLGLGIRHSLNPYLPALPLQIAVQTVWQRASIDNEDGDPLVEITTFAANVQVGKRIGALGLYAALQAEQAGAEVRYNYIPDALNDSPSDPVPIRFTLDASNKLRGILGADARLGPIHLGADLGIGHTRTISVGLGLAF